MLIEFIIKRENIRRRRARGLPAPWTDDSVLAKWRFCNIDREHDRETMWIKDNIRTPYASHSSLWFNLVISRLINWSSTLKELGFYAKWGPDHFIQTMDSIKGKKWSSAYIVSTNGIQKSKPNYIAEDVLTPLWERRKEITFSTCAEWAEFLLSCNGFAGFMANQIITDLKYTRYLDSATDRSTFCLAGPGTRRGLNRYFNRPLNTTGDFHAELIFVRKKIMRDARIKRMFPHTFDDLNNLANTFCEYDKFLRVKNGEGTPRSRFTPTPTP